MNFLKIVGVSALISVVITLVAFLLLNPYLTISYQEKEIGKLKAELEKVKEELRIEEEVAREFSDRIDSLRKIVKENILTVKKEELVSEWRTAKVLAYEDYCLVTIQYKVKKINKYTKEYDLLIRDEDMAKRSETYIHIWGSWNFGSIINDEVFMGGKVIFAPTFESVSRGDILKLLNNPNVNRFQSPWAVAADSIIKAIIEKEIQ